VLHSLLLWKFFSPRFTLRWAPVSEGTIKLSGRGGRPIIFSQSPSFQAASILAKVGCTGTSRGGLVVTDFSTFVFVS
jgi:hypothetical protein